MAGADTYVVLDHVQFKRRYYENRNRIVAPDGTVQWIGVPVSSKGKFEQPINEVRIDNDRKWKRKMLDTIRHRYAKAPGFSRYFPEFMELVEAFSGDRLIDFNLVCIDFFRRHFSITTPMVFSSVLLPAENRPSGSDLILRLCLATGASRYFCGPSGRDYLDLSAFEEKGVTVMWQDFEHPVYPQQCQEFVSHLSALDFLFCSSNVDF